MGRNLICVLLPSGGGGGGGGGCTHKLPIRGCDAEQSMVFYLSVLNRVYTEFRVSLS